MTPQEVREAETRSSSAHRQLFVFDLDDTLIAGYMGTHGRDFDQVEVLPGRAERLRRLRQQGHRVGIATNQGGVAFGYVTAEQVWSKLWRVTDALDIEHALIAVCFGHPNATVQRYGTSEACARRKPAGEMTRELMGICRIATQQTLFVGDRPEDQMEAKNAGVCFQWTDDFFSP